MRSPLQPTEPAKRSEPLLVVFSYSYGVSTEVNALVTSAQAMTSVLKAWLRKHYGKASRVEMEERLARVRYHLVIQSGDTFTSLGKAYRISLTQAKQP